MTIVEQGGGPAPQAAPDLIKETTTQTFVKDVIEESKRQPVLIDFWAPWCGPCRQLTPVLEKAVRAAKGKVKLVKMNIDEHPAIPGQMGIQSIPAVIAFVGGQPADGFMGAVPESQVNAFIDKLTKGMTAPGEPNIAEILQEAEAVLAEGDPAAAAQIYAEVLGFDATNIAALAGLAKCYVTTGAIEQAKQTLAMVPESKRNDAAVKAVQASIDLAEQAQAVGPVTELEQKLAANPLDHQARFDLATALNAQGNRAEATNQLLEIVKRDRKWNDDGARKQLVQFFEAWGGADEATVDGRKRLSTILFSYHKPASGSQMPINAEYRGPGELPEIIPVFPLPGALLLPRGQMPLNIFEPRYLAMVDDALRDGHRLIGMIQPDIAHSRDEARPTLFRVGCVGRITQLAESGDGRYILELTGVARFKVVEEVTALTAYRQCKVDFFAYADDFVARKGEEAVDRAALLDVLTDFLEANNLKVDWEGIESAPNEALVNALAMMSPYGPAEKQAMLEAPDLKTRAEILVAVTEMDLAKKRTSGETGLQ